MKNLAVRAASGAVYIALIVGAILAGAPWFFALLCLFAILGVIEVDKMASPKLNIVATALDIAITALMILTVFDGLYKVGYYILSLGFVLATLRFVWALWDRRDDGFRCMAGSMLAILYLGVPLTLFCVMYQYSKWLPLALFILIWSNDTGAYLFGSWLGKHKLFERLSPKKSWEGFFGGMLCCVGVGIGCNYMFPSIEWTVWHWAIYAVVVCIAATLGDLFESMLKRASHVKDSGNIIPGHGGILDRIDSLLFVVPFTLLFIIFCGYK